MALLQISNILPRNAHHSTLRIHGFESAAFVCVLAIVALALFRISTKQRRLRLPPGPRQLPFFGNVQQLPEEYQEYTFADWGKRFGDVVYARFFTTPVLVLNNVHTAHALLEKRGAKYSSRPRFTYFTDIVEMRHIIVMPYADRWRRHRRWFQNTLLARNALNAYEPLQRDELQKLLRDLLRDPGEALAHLKRYAAALMLGVAYGYSPSTKDDEFVRMSEEAMHLALDGGGPGSALVDFFPVLRYVPTWMPGMEFKRRGLRARQGYKEMHRIPLERVKRNMAAGTARPCVATALLEEAARDGIVEKADEDEISSALGVMYVAGTDTTSAVLVAFVLAMVLHPDVLRKAQAEVDSVVGDGRLPEPDDRAALPYLEAVLKEVYRWLAPAPLGTPHELTEHDEYTGFHMPKGALIVTNIWAMSRDEQYFTDPDRFDPERFLDVGADAGEAMDPRKFVFGFGRRICPGRVLADQSIFIVAATLVAAFDIRPARTPDGNEIPPKVAFTSGTVRHPKPFVCDISPRSGKADLILGTANGNGVKY